MKKRLVSFVLLILLSIFLVACGEEQAKQSELEKYKGTKFIITYICNDEIVDIENTTYVCGVEQELPTPEIRGFDGWFDNKNFIGEAVTKVTDTEFGNKIFYAKIDRAKIVYTIDYYDGTTKLVLTPNTYTLGTELALPIPSEKENYEFEGWYTEKEFKNQLITLPNDIEKDLVLYAKYKATKVLLTNALTFNDVVKTVNNKQGVEIAYPSTGTINTLVIPVDFTDYPASNDITETIETGMFSDGSETGWESLASYYEKSSYGKLKIIGDISEVYHTNKASSYYTKKNETTAVNEIIKAALNGVDSKIDFSKYDNNNDGYVDAIYFIYTAPVDYDGNVSDLWWAYCDQYTNTTEKYDGKKINYYMFAGTDFFEEETAGGVKLEVNAETFIHETGHLLGLDDYYDYDDSDRNNKGGIGGGDMMDYNVGDHNAYSKSILGWITPELVNLSLDTKEFNVELRPFCNSGDAVIIAKNNITSFYSEYYIVDYYSPEGLNAMAAGVNGLFSASGVRIYHISANLTSEKIECMWDITKYNNASAKYKLIKLVEADGKNDIDKEKESSNSDLFGAGNKYTSLKWNDGTSLNISFNVISMDAESAKIQIVKTK